MNTRTSRRRLSHPLVLLPSLATPAFAQCPSSWLPLSSGFNGPGFTMASSGNSVYAGGGFTTAGGLVARGIARWDGTSWFSLDGGVNGPVHGINFLPNGDLLATGNFGSTTSGLPVNHIARWDGSAWHTVGPGFNTGAFAIAVLTGGDVVVGGTFSVLAKGGIAVNRIVRWDGLVWHPLGVGVGGLFADVQSLLALPGGGLIAGGQFTTAGGLVANRIARWDPTPSPNGTWSTIGSGPNNGCNNGVTALLRQPNGDIIAGGQFTTAGGTSSPFISRWNGTTWSPLGAGLNGQVAALAPLASGDFMAAGGFFMSGGVSANRVARWNNAAGTWSALGTGPDNIVYGGTTQANGRVFITGPFTSAGGSPALCIAEYRPACYSNCDCSTGAAALTANDFQCFLDQFAASNTNANCDGSTAIPILTANDFQCFLDTYAAGCL